MIQRAILIGLASFVVATLAGGYRNFCIYKQSKYHGVDSPPIWHFLWFRALSWLLVAATSLIAAVMASAVATELTAPFTSVWTDKILFGLVFGATIGLRWGISATLAMKVFLGRI